MGDTAARLGRAPKVNLLCGRRHQTTVPCFAQLADAPQCHALTDQGYCGLTAWPDPSWVQSGDIVALLDPIPLGTNGPGRRIVRALIEHWNRDPDRPATLIDEFGLERTVLFESWWTPNQPYPALRDGTPSGRGPGGGSRALLTLTDAAVMLPQLQAIAADVRARKREAKIQMQVAQEQVAVSREEKPTTHGSPAPWDVPAVLYKYGTDCHESPALTYHMTALPAWRRHMADLQRTHRAYWEILRLSFEEQREPADIAAMLAISKPNARVRLFRARQEMQTRMASEMVAC